MSPARGCGSRSLQGAPVNTDQTTVHRSREVAQGLTMTSTGYMQRRFAGALMTPLLIGTVACAGDKAADTDSAAMTMSDSMGAATAAPPASASAMDGPVARLLAAASGSTPQSRAAASTAAMQQVHQTMSSSMQQLKGLSGAGFDRACMDGQLAGHQQTLDLSRTLHRRLHPVLHGTAERAGSGTLAADRTGETRYSDLPRYGHAESASQPSLVSYCSLRLVLPRGARSASALPCRSGPAHCRSRRKCGTSGRRIRTREPRQRLPTAGGFDQRSARMDVAVLTCRDAGCSSAAPRVT